MDMLVLRLRAPMVSFGDVAIDETRPTDVLPGLSMITGLIGNALGYDYTDRSKLQRIQDRLSIASRADCEGTPLRDYQTARVSSDDLLWRSDGSVSRREGGSKGVFTIQRWKYYRADVSVTVLISLTPENESPTLEDIRKAFKKPERPLFLGRASCLPSCRLCFEKGGEEIVKYESFEDALKNIVLHGNLVLEDVKGNDFIGASSDSADQTKSVMTERPLTPEKLLSSKQEDHFHVFERKDVRRWTENVHGGNRFVWRDSIQIHAKEGS